MDGPGDASERCHRAGSGVFASFHYERYLQDHSVAPNRTEVDRVPRDEALGYRILRPLGPSYPPTTSTRETRDVYG